jgi:hypothetical protein
MWYFKSSHFSCSDWEIFLSVSNKGPGIKNPHFFRSIFAKTCFFVDQRGPSIYIEMVYFNTWHAMKIRTFKSRVITITLILSLLSIGAVHAESTCDGSCKCHLRGSPGRAPFGLSVSPWGPLHRGAVIHSLHGSKYVAEGDLLDAGCHEGTRKLSCDMETPGDMYALQRSLRAVSGSENSPKVDSILLVALIHPNIEHAPGLSFSHRVIERKIPDPLYLHHLSLLC